jgi:hypothetical protein
MIHHRDTEVTEKSFFIGREIPPNENSPLFHLQDPLSELFSASIIRKLVHALERQSFTPTDRYLPIGRSRTLCALCASVVRQRKSGWLNLVN